ncbi:cytochrome b/b6 domain-containing protein [Pseudomonas sp. CGJS7]|uniref:cytochrome b/b6 domain-containing protein n=1 Tax=Pseudomonas sp. CGJS7 TaxID=3109348 RepID=UPI00300996D3
MRSVYRHRRPVRVMHWINAIALIILFGSGLQIFNAHPRLYWGQRSDPERAWLSMDAQGGRGHWRGVVRIDGHAFDTTGVFGASDTDGQRIARGFPAWLTIPSNGPMSDGGDGRWPLTSGRRWHFFFAWLFVINGLCYLAYGAISRHLSRDLWLSRADWRGLGRSLLDHLRLRHPHGEDALRYNALQKLAYLGVVFVLGIGIVLMGLAMSPRMDTVLAPMVDAVGGRQSARTLHFLIAFGFVGFVIVHLAAILLSGPLNQLRGMITGYYRIAESPGPLAAAADQLPQAADPQLDPLSAEQANHGR